MQENMIVVGYDGSAGSQKALRWALAEAAHRPASIQLVCAFEWPVGVAMLAPSPPVASGESLREAVEAMVSKAVAQAAGQAPAGVAVSGVVIDGPAVMTLCDQSRGARMMALGSRGLGGFAGLLVGSVSVAVATHAHCPVVVVRGGEPSATQGRPVVVGVDESPEGRVAVGFAMQEAADRSVGLVAVRAWSPPPVAWRSDIRPLVLDVDELESAERHVVREVLGPWQEKFPEVAVSFRLLPGTAGHALTTASREAQLVVVGSRGRGGFRGLLLGSVSHQLLHHALCPVAIVRELSEA